MHVRKVYVKYESLSTAFNFFKVYSRTRKTYIFLLGRTNRGGGCHKPKYIVIYFLFCWIGLNLKNFYFWGFIQ